MKKIICITFLLVASFGFSQNSSEELKAFYTTAITNHIENLQKGSKSIDGKTYLLMANNIPESYLPNEIKGHKIKYFNIYDRQNKTALKKGVNIISLQAPVLAGGKIAIGLIDFRASYKRKNYDLANGGGSKTVFEYSCQDNKWHLVKTDFSGI